MGNRALDNAAAWFFCTRLSGKIFLFQLDIMVMRALQKIPLRLAGDKGMFFVRRRLGMRRAAAEQRQRSLREVGFLRCFMRNKKPGLGRAFFAFSA